jgi:retron-type reverse transcriptase
MHIESEEDFICFLIKKGITLSDDEYEEEISKIKKLNRNSLPYFYDLDDFVKTIGFSSDLIHLFLDKKWKAYSTFKLLKKNGGFREIDAPSKPMKAIQRWILDHILYNIDVGKYAHGFAPGRSIVTNAIEHQGQKLVLGIDLKDFFPSIKYNRVLGYFKTIGYKEDIAIILTEFCTFKWRLPQGAPTSPMISNLIAWYLDNDLARFCEERGLTYTRYADDITISGDQDLPRYTTIIIKKIEESGFSINEEKLRLLTQGTCQKVTGVIVNDKISLGKDNKRKLKAIVYNIKKNGPILENRTEDPYFKERIFGHLGHANLIDPEFALPLIEDLKKIDWAPYHESVKQNIQSAGIIRNLQKKTHSHIIKFNQLGFFKQIEIIPLSWSKEFSDDFKKLVEKCKDHGVDTCESCLSNPDKKYEKCLKYIFGHFIGTTGGHHHGHERYDIARRTDHNGKERFIAFVLKSKRNTNSKNSCFNQCFKSITDEAIDVISIATNHDLDHESELEIETLMRLVNKGKPNDEMKYFCPIYRNEMGQIFCYFRKKFAYKLKQ